MASTEMRPVGQGAMGKVIAASVDLLKQSRAEAKESIKRLDKVITLLDETHEAAASGDDVKTLVQVEVTVAMLKQVAEAICTSRSRMVEPLAAILGTSHEMRAVEQRRTTNSDRVNADKYFTSAFTGMCPSIDKTVNRDEAGVAMGLIHAFQTSMARMQLAFACAFNGFERLSLVSVWMFKSVKRNHKQ